MASSVKANLLDDGVVDTLVSVGAKSGVHTSASGFKEKLRVRYEKLWILEQRAMTGVRIHNQLRIRNVLRKRERVDCGHHDVVIAVHHQRRLFDRLQIGIAFAPRLPPFHQSRLLRLHCLNRRRRISMLALMTPLPECPSGGLTCVRRREEEKQKIFAHRHGIAGNFRNTRILPRFAVTRSGPGEHEAPDEMRMAKDQTLRNVASDGEAEHVNPRQLQGTDECSAVIAHRVDGVRRFAARTGDAGVVEEDYRTPLRKPVRYKRIPVIKAAAEVLKEDERRSAFRAEAPVCVADSISLDEASWSRDVGVFRHI